MTKRLDQCRQKGFDGVEADNVDGYSNSSGFPLTAAHQLAYNRFLAMRRTREACPSGSRTTWRRSPRSSRRSTSRSTSSASSTPSATCSPVPSAGKAVFIAEYDVVDGLLLPDGAIMKIMAIRKTLSLDAFREVC